MSIFIECRNKDAEIKQNNGDWTTILGEPLTINTGDQLFIKNSFIDTQESSNNKINVSQDTTLGMTFGFYKTYWDLVGLDGYGGAPHGIDYQDYVTCFKSVILTPDNLNHHIYKSARAIVYKQDVNNGQTIPTKVNFSYTDFEGNPQTGSFSIIGLKGSESQNINAIQDIGTRGEIEFVPPLNVLSSQYNIEIDFDVDDNLAGKNVAVPLTYTKYVTIPKGSYEPDDLCEIINDVMANNSNPASGFSLETGGVLTGAKQVITERFESGGAKTNDLILIYQNQILEYASSHSYPAGDSIFIGTNQFEIAFNQATKKFAFSVIHFPHFYQKNIAVEIGTFAGGTYTINKNGGIFITNLSSTGDDLWEEMGFGETHPTLYPKFNWEEIVDPVDAGKQLIIPNTILVDKEQTTGATITLDSAVIKDDDKQNLTFAADPITSSASPTDNNEISGSTSILDKDDNFGYFIVEIGHKLKNEFYTPNNNYRNFQQVVSKYYVQNSYTTGSSDGSLIYTHNGAPTLLESFQCRILDSDKQLADNIGEDNTIHIVLVRATQNK